MRNRKKPPKSGPTHFYRKAKISDKRSFNFNSKIGLKFGRLTPIKIHGYFVHRGTGKKKLVYKCECECGSDVWARSGDLASGLIKSCGCYRSDLTIKFNMDKKRKDVLSGFSRMWQSYNRGARIRNIEFKLSKSDFLNLTQDFCYYCNRPPTSRFKLRIRGMERKFFLYNGIDRLDPNKGYIKNNVVTCCSTCNRVKWKLTEEEFICLVKNIYKNRCKPKK